jgi:hypothetical protein
LLHQRDASPGWHIREANNPGVLGAGEIHERSKIRIDRNQNAALSCSNPQQRSVAWVGILVARIPYIMPLLA